MFDDFDDLSDDDFGFGDNIYTDDEDTELFGDEGGRADEEPSYNNFIEDFEEPGINDTGFIDAEFEPAVEEIPVVEDIVDDSELFEEPIHVNNHPNEMKKYENTHAYNSSEKNKPFSEQELFISIQMDTEKEKDTPEPNDFAETEHLESSTEENIEERVEATKNGTNYLKPIEAYEHETDSDNNYEYNYQYDEPKSNQYKTKQKSKKARTHRKRNFQHQAIFKIIKGPFIFVATVLLIVFVPLFIEKTLNLKTAKNKENTNKSNSSQNKNNNFFSEKEKEYADIINSKEFNEFLKKNGYTILDNEASTNTNDIKIVSSRFKTISELDNYIKETSSTIYTAAKNNTYSYLEEKNKKAKTTTNHAKYTTAINEILHLLVTNQTIYSETGNEKIYTARFNNIVKIMTYIDILNSMIVNDSTLKEIKKIDEKLQTSEQE